MPPESVKPARRRRKRQSPFLEFDITPEGVETAIQAKSGGCLVADAIKQKYPHYTNVTVDMATIRLTDRQSGERYIYLTPDSAQLALVYFDNGWSIEPRKIVLRRAVQITRIKTGSKKRSNAARRPTAQGPTTVAADGTRIGGHPPRRGTDNPNLLAGRHRIYGAQVGDLGEVFRTAVDEALKAKTVEGQTPAA